MDTIEQFVNWLDRQIPAGSWHDKIYSYCERGGDASFWAEPVNALSNGAFFIAAFVALVLWIRSPGTNRRFVDLLLIVLVFVIGAGSFLFHTSATRWASIADVLPIVIFILVFLGYTLRRFMGLPWIITLAGVGLFYGLMWYVGEMRCDGVRCLNGSAGYLPALGVLLLTGLALLVMRHRAGASLTLAGLILAASVTFRTYDKAWCHKLMSIDGGPLGTHFLWHGLNALLLFLLLRAAIKHGGAGR